VLRRTTAWDDGSDHVCLVGEPVDVGRGDHEVTPMRLTDADDIDAGHAAEERTTPDDLQSMVLDSQVAQHGIATSIDLT